MGKAKNEPQVFTLVVEVGRKPDDGLPDGASGAGILCYAAAADEAEAVRETVSLLEISGLAPLDVTSYGSLAARQLEAEIDPDELVLMERARTENAVVVAEITPFDDKDG